MNKANRVGIFIVFAILMLSGNFILQAQAKKQLTFVGKIAPEVIEKGTGTIEITKNGKEKSTIDIPINGRFSLDLDFFSEYTLKYKYPKHIDKIIHISTKIPNDVWQKNPDFPPFPVIVQLVKKTKENVKSEKCKPLFEVSYDKKIDNFVKLVSPEN